MTPVSVLPRIVSASHNEVETETEHVQVLVYTFLMIRGERTSVLACCSLKGSACNGLTSCTGSYVKTTRFKDISGGQKNDPKGNTFGGPFWYSQKIYFFWTPKGHRVAPENMVINLIFE